MKYTSFFIYAVLFVIHFSYAATIKVVGLARTDKKQKVVLLYDSHLDSGISFRKDILDEIATDAEKELYEKMIKNHYINLMQYLPCQIQELRNLLAWLSSNEKKTSIFFEFRQCDMKQLNDCATTTAEDVLEVFSEHIFRYGKESGALKLFMADPRIKNDGALVDMMMNFLGYIKDLSAGKLHKDFHITIDGYLNMIKNRIYYLDRTFRQPDLAYFKKDVAKIWECVERDYYKHIDYIQFLMKKAKIPLTANLLKLMAYAVSDKQKKEDVPWMYTRFCFESLTLQCDYIELYMLSQVLQSKDEQIIIACGAHHAEMLCRYLKQLYYIEDFEVPKIPYNTILRDNNEYSWLKLAGREDSPPVEKLDLLIHTYFKMR